LRAAAVVPALVLGALLLATGCSGDHPARPAAAAAATPGLGGAAPRTHAPPSAPMDAVERPVWRRLARQVAGQGLTLHYLACPHWDGRVPARLTCRGYVDGLVARVAVRLQRGGQGADVGFDAWMLDGVVATRQLEETLRGRGWTTADCGDRPAYPATVGRRLVCHVERSDAQEYVVATVSDPHGAVTIRHYGTAASPG